MLPWTAEKDRVLRRHAVYIRDRMQVPISDPQYLMWDKLFCEDFDRALERYEKLLYQQTNWDQNGCANTGDIPRMRLKFAGLTLLAYRFSYAIATVLPLSSNEIIRHECNNAFCVNPRHLMVGDQRQNFEDFVAEQAYGTRWELLEGYNTKKNSKKVHPSHPNNPDHDIVEESPGD